MKRFLIGVLCLFLTNAYAYDVEKQLETRLAKTISYVDNHQNAVWPGFKLGTKPMISLVDDDLFNPTFAHLYAFDFAPKNPGWQQIILDGKPAYYLDHDEYKIAGTQDGGMAILYGDILIDGQRTFVFVTPTNWITDANPTRKLLDVVHARFEILYGSNRYDYLKYDNNSYNRPQIVKLTYLELNILKKYLEDDNAQNDEMLKDALAVNTYRLDQLNYESTLYQESLQKAENIPNYVSLKSLELSEKEYLPYIPDSCDISKINVENVNVCESMQHIILPGIIYGKALDHQRGHTWKTEILTRGVSMQDLLLEAYSMSEFEAKKRAENIINKNEYGYNEISQTVDHAIQPYLDEMKTMMVNYDQQPGVEMQIYEIQMPDLAMNVKDDGDLKWKKAYPLSNFTTLLTELYGEYNDFFDRDNAVIIDYNRAPIVYYHTPDMLSQWLFRFKIPSDAMLVIDGNSINVQDFLASHQRAAFGKLRIETKYINIFVSGLKGFLESDNGILKLRTSYVFPSASDGSKVHEQMIMEKRKKVHDRLLFG